MADSQGRVILLVGPSCAGKSTLAKAVQALSPEPWLVQSLDGLFAATPEAWGGSGEHRLDGFFYDWEGEPGASDRRVACGAIGRGLLEGFHRAVAAYAGAGVNVVADDMLLDLAVLRDWADTLAGTPTLLASVTAPKAVLLRREAERQLHPTPGLGRIDIQRSQSMTAAR
jgi:chloramphenicol 3-O phosphotransferase